MLQSLFAFAFAAAISADELFASMSIPVPKSSFIPSFQVFSKHASFNDDKMLITDMKLNTSIPTIRLDNFPKAIKSISCSSQFITLSFYNQATCKQVFDIWKLERNLAFLIGHEHQCNNGMEGTIVVYGMRTNQDNTVIYANYDTVDRDEVVDNWDAVITEHASRSNFKSLLQKEKTLNLNFDLERFFKGIGDPTFNLFGQNLIHFEHCFSNGSVTYKLELKGHRRTLLSYKFKLSGEFNATADVKLGFLRNQEIRLFRTSVLTIPMTPLSIPGILNIGPEFQIQLAIVGFSDIELTAGFGFDLHIPINYEVASKDMKSEPQHKTLDKAIFNPHPLKTNVQLNATYIGGLINIRPRFVFGIQVMNRDICALRANFNSQLGIIHRFKKATACVNKTSVEVFHRHFIGASIKAWPADLVWKFWDTGRRLIFASCKADIGKGSYGRFLNATDAVFDD
jgi:hypothetical protein